MGRRAYTVVFSSLWLASVAWAFWLCVDQVGHSIYDGPTPFVFAIFAAAGPFLALRGWDLHESSYLRSLELAGRLPGHNPPQGVSGPVRVPGRGEGP